uniref:SWIM-type domain-containing protein n=1 Tax=Clastoptera arizonana TaxID=38151 RepID=A0A1B6CZW7_9HEMI
MARLSTWRLNCPLSVKKLHYKIMTEDCGLFLLRQSGPFGFIVQKDNHKPVQVRLGDPHKCSCKEFNLTRELCLHICWVILKKFKLLSSNQLSFQLGLVPRELDVCLQPKEKIHHPVKVFSKERVTTAAVVARKIKSTDSCSICLQLFRSVGVAVTFCKYGCGNAVHTHCMVQVALHQTSPTPSSDRLLTCPLCRGVFSSWKELLESQRKEMMGCTKLSPLPRHDLTCAFCSTTPIAGNVYRCTQCPQVIVCAACVNCSNFLHFHSNHPLSVKSDLGEKWRPSNLRRAIKTKPEVEAGRNPEETKLIVDLQSECGYRLHEIKSLRMPPSLNSSPHRTLRRQNAITPSYNLPPPEVRIIQMCLSKRPPEVKVEITPRQCHKSEHPTPSLSFRPQKKTKKKKSQKDTKEVENSLAGRALGAQVHPLMAVLMSPRPLSLSHNSDFAHGARETEEEEEKKKPSREKSARLTITSLEFPDQASIQHSSALPPRRLRACLGRTPRSSSSATCIGSAFIKEN